jgi:hypothetical protein
MRVRVLATLALGLVIAPIPVHAQEVETLRREIEQLKRQLETTQQQYQQAIEALTQRLQRLEVRPQVAAAPVGDQTGSSPTLPSLMELARPREPFSLYAQTTTGPGGTGAAPRGRFLFDMGVVGDFIANVTSRRVERDQIGTFAGRENRVFPREIELAFFGQVDPYARATVILEAAEEFEDGQRALEFGLAEAYLELFLMCLVLTGIHAYLGVHVIAREVVFVDIALAQIAALGAAAALLLDLPLDSSVAYAAGLGATLVGAAVLALTRTRGRRLSQEAAIGVVYAVSAAAAVLLVGSRASRGGASSPDARGQHPRRDAG